MDNLTIQKLRAAVAAGLLTPAEAQLAQQVLEAQADVREPWQASVSEGNFVPSDAGRPVTPLPDDVVITAEDVDAAFELWDEFMPDYAGLLDAQVSDGR